MLNATLVEREDITSDLLILKVKPDFEIPEFLPGQYVAIGLFGSAPRPVGFPQEREIVAPDKLIKRAYSLGSSPIQKEHLEFYVAVVPDGSLSSRLAVLQPGDRLFSASKITGTFTLQGVPDEANLVFVATGTGLAPYISMLRTPGVLQRGREITVIHGVRFVKDLAYSRELAGYAQEFPNFRYLPVVSRAQEDDVWIGARGYVHTFFEQGLVQLIPGRDHVFLCGNPAMIDSMEQRLIALGYKEHSRKSPGDMHLERYW